MTIEATMSTKHPSNRSRQIAKILRFPSRPAGPVKPGRLPTEFLTRDEAVNYLRTVIGLPISLGSALQLSRRDDFAQPSFWWGRRAIYTQEALRAWVESKARRTRRTKRKKHHDGGFEVPAVVSRNSCVVGKRRRSATIIPLPRKSPRTPK